MIALLLRLWFALAIGGSADNIDERAHRVCENTVYAIVEPDLVSTDEVPDPVTVAGEQWCEVLCRNEPWWGPPHGTECITAQICIYDESYDCDGPEGDECAPYDCYDAPVCL